MHIVCILSSWCHCHPETQLSLASFKSRVVLPFWYWLIQVVLVKRPLNGCSSSSSSSSKLKWWCSECRSGCAGNSGGICSFQGRWNRRRSSASIPPCCSHFGKSTEANKNVTGCWQSAQYWRTFEKSHRSEFSVFCFLLYVGLIVQFYDDLYSHKYADADVKQRQAEGT